MIEITYKIIYLYYRKNSDVAKSKKIIDSKR